MLSMCSPTNLIDIAGSWLAPQSMAKFLKV